MFIVWYLSVANDKATNEIRRQESPAQKLAYDEMQYTLTLEMKYKIVNCENDNQIYKSTHPSHKYVKTINSKEVNN